MHRESPESNSPACAIDIRDLEFSYSRGFRIAVKRLTIAPEEQVLLAGPSGSGKSTLLHLIAGVEHPSKGSIFIGGTDIVALRRGAQDRFRGNHVGMIFQTFNLLHGFSARENVEVPLMLAGHSASEQRQLALEALTRLSIDAPDAPVDTLSVGQQQRVAVARAIAGGKTVVLADEPTASLDRANAAATVALIKEAAKRAGAALLMSSHDPEIRGAFDRVVEIEAFTREGARR